MLWLALHLPYLPLEVFTRGGVAPSAAPLLAITSAPGNQAEIIVVSVDAHRLGVRPGLSVSAACALAPALHLQARDLQREHSTLSRIAAWALQYTSFVTIPGTAPCMLLLEIGGSLKLFGGLNKLWRGIAQGMSELGFRTGMACAPTPLAAECFARAGERIRIQHRDALAPVLAKLPVTLLGDASHDLARFGVHTIGDCLKLPRDGLARRAGPRLLDALDRALGALPDPRIPFIPPQRYSASLPLPAPVSNAEALLFAARRLLAELCGWLSATGHGVQAPQFEFLHEKIHKKQIVTIITLELAQASRELDHLTTLLRERLARTTLPCAAIEITVHSGRVVPLASHNLSFLPDDTTQGDSAARFIERLNARLGREAIHGLIPWPDYRPEHAWRACQPGAHYEPTKDDTFTSSLTRPLWLLTPAQPLREVHAQPHDGAPLSLISGPERIEAGWWDGRHAARDYYIARNAAHALLWIYRERGADARWFVHGVFA